ncbi:hypothetical protein, partial [Streptomyces sp. NPDC001274]
MTESPSPRIGILVVAYNAETTLERTLDRIPADFRSRIAERTKSSVVSSKYASTSRTTRAASPRWSAVLRT